MYNIETLTQTEKNKTHLTKTLHMLHSEWQLKTRVVSRNHQVDILCSNLWQDAKLLQPSLSGLVQKAVTALGF